MKKICWSVVGFSFLCIFLTGCETKKVYQVDRRPRFYESASVDLVLRFSRWDTIYMTVPDTREGGFLPILTRVDIEQELKARRSGRNLAVVVLGFLFPPDQEAQLVRDWDVLLSGYGYRRVVILRTGAPKGIDGLLIAHDSGIAAADDKTRSIRPIAALPSAIGANAANSSGR